MVVAELNEKDFSLYMDYCFSHPDYGSFKYLSEISVPNEEYEDFLQWLYKCERAELTFILAVIERYEGRKLLYGFSNFEINENPNVKAFDFSLANKDIIFDRFTLWNKSANIS